MAAKKKKATKKVVSVKKTGGVSPEVQEFRDALRELLSDKKATAGDLALVASRFKNVKLEGAIKITGLGMSKVYNPEVIRVLTVHSKKHDKFLGQFVTKGDVALEVWESLGKKDKQKTAVYTSVSKTLNELVKNNQIKKEMAAGKPVYALKG